MFLLISTFLILSCLQLYTGNLLELLCCLTSKLRLSREHGLFISIVSIFSTWLCLQSSFLHPTNTLTSPFLQQFSIFHLSPQLAGFLPSCACLFFLSSLPEASCLSSLISFSRRRKSLFRTKDAFQEHSYCRCSSHWELHSKGNHQGQLELLGQENAFHPKHQCIYLMAHLKGNISFILEQVNSSGTKFCLPMP